MSAATPWTATSPINAGGEKNCDWVSVSPMASTSYEHCTRPYKDVVSDEVRMRSDHVFPDCQVLPLLWALLANEQEGDELFVDAGANIGSCTLLMAGVTNATTVAFEPSASNLHYLTRSLLHANNAALRRRVTLYPVGLGVSARSYPLFEQPGNAGNTVLGAPMLSASSQSASRAEVRSLDAILGVSVQQPRIRLLKLDVQGMETKVLRGARRMLSAHRVRCIEFELATSWLGGHNSSWSQLFGLLRRSGYALLQLRTRCPRLRRCTSTFVRGVATAGLRPGVAPKDGQYIACEARSARALPRGDFYWPVGGVGG